MTGPFDEGASLPLQPALQFTRRQTESVISSDYQVKGRLVVRTEHCPGPAAGSKPLAPLPLHPPGEVVQGVAVDL